MAEISVIVPVYNVEKYLAKCLDSIINQTFSDIEIICVNDGSTDKSAKILKEYQKKDKRIKIIKKKNGGLSSARNAGLKEAKGKYISFIDSDDWIDKTMLEKLYRNVDKYDSDIILCAVHLFDEELQEIDDNNEYYNLECFNNSFDNRNFSFEETKTFIMDVSVMAWNKLYKKEFLDRSNASFPEGLIFEDGPFFFSIFFKTDKVSLVRQALYFYRINRKGSIVKKGGKKLIDIIDVVELMYNSIKDLSCFNEIRNKFYREKAADIMYRYDLLDWYNQIFFSKKLAEKKFFFDENIFDLDFMRKEHEWVFKRVLDIKDRADIIGYYYKKFKIKLMYKVMEILYTEQNIYYFKYKKLKLKLKKHANLCDVWYEKDRIYVVILKKIKFDFKFEYSKLEQK